ncbi:MAG: hypothetical protein IKU00_09670 [Bacteroidales bacterium]|nr:hypothetical protein [Bacteroidales bacterium]
MKALAPIMLMIAVTFAMGCKKDKADGDGTVNGHTYVDLGLPSGTLWAACNVGATKPEGYGDYFAWGETATKSTYNWSAYKYCNNGDLKQLTKYCNDTHYGYNGFTDNLFFLQAIDDAATANWGDGWCMPTKEQWEELFEHTAQIFTFQNGAYGMLFSASNGASIFLPAAGIRWYDELYNVGDYGYYWSSLLDIDHPFRARHFDISPGLFDLNDYRRFNGLSVRAVRSAPQN